MSIEQIARLAQDDALPVPALDLSALAASTSAFSAPYTTSDAARNVVTRGYSAEDPWSVPKFPSATVTSPPVPAVPATNGAGSVANGAPSTISGSGLPKEWWRKQETIHVNVLGQQGFLLNRYLAYEVTSDVRGINVSMVYVLMSVHYSEEHLCLGATQSSSFSGTVLSSDIRSGCSQHCRLNA